MLFKKSPCEIETSYLFAQQQIQKMCYGVFISVNNFKKFVWLKQGESLKASKLCSDLLKLGLVRLSKVKLKNVKSTAL